MSMPKEIRYAVFLSLTLLVGCAEPAVKGIQPDSEAGYNATVNKDKQGKAQAGAYTGSDADRKKYWRQVNRCRELLPDAPEADIDQCVARLISRQW